MKRKRAGSSGYSIEPLEVRCLLSASAAADTIPVPMAVAEVSPPAPAVASDGTDSATTVIEITLSPGAAPNLPAELIATLPNLSNEELDSVLTELVLSGDLLTIDSVREPPSPEKTGAAPRFIVDLQGAQVPSSPFGANAAFVFLQPHDDPRLGMSPDKLDAFLHSVMPPSTSGRDGDFRYGMPVFDVRDMSRDATLDLARFRSFDVISSNLVSAATIPINGHVTTQQPQALLIGDVDDKGAVDANFGAIADLMESAGTQPAVALRGMPQTSAQRGDQEIVHRLSPDSKNSETDDATNGQYRADDEMTADLDEPSLIPEQIVGVQSYLGIDWNGLESRMSDFLGDLEAAGAKLRSSQTAQSHATVVWISVTAVATFVLEWACRKSRVPAVERNVYGVLSDRSSVSRHKDYQTGETYRVS